ncbi:hypothetical protein SAMN05216505_11569 [Streptomyces prasinopilosus]|uniref:Simple sugar transport system permease protein n=1 Tax=Streptomyces prasinopilosus TaxID=67344 RepID=A0A1G6ZLA7_9ACTN|nr:hypothetical protein SAMN05216505_11569 [Streptomyces prasinopilosus]
MKEKFPRIEVIEPATGWKGDVASAELQSAPAAHPDLNGICMRAGGVGLNGGRGTLFGALTGVLTLQLVVNVMTLAGVPPLWNRFLNGAIIVALVLSRFASGEKQEERGRPGWPDGTRPPLARGGQADVLARPGRARSSAEPAHRLPVGAGSVSCRQRRSVSRPGR